MNVTREWEKFIWEGRVITFWNWFEKWSFWGFADVFLMYYDTGIFHSLENILNFQENLMNFFLSFFSSQNSFPTRIPYVFFATKNSYQHRVIVKCWYK